MNSLSLYCFIYFFFLPKTWNFAVCPLFIGNLGCFLCDLWSGSGFLIRSFLSESFYLVLIVCAKSAKVSRMRGMRIGQRIVGWFGDLPKIHVGFGASSAETSNIIFIFFAQRDSLLHFLETWLGLVVLLCLLPLCECAIHCGIAMGVLSLTRVTCKQSANWMAVWKFCPAAANWLWIITFIQLNNMIVQILICQVVIRIRLLWMRVT